MPVLVVGGGPVGLTASLLLSRFGVPSVLVERHPGTSLHPKARNINARTMEVFRAAGAESAVRAAGLPPERSRYIVWARSLAGEELERRVFLGSQPQALEISPSRSCICAQDDLEPALRAVAESLGPGTLRFGTELAGFEQDDDGVTATLRDHDGDTRVRARYVIAADGARGRVREALGIPLHGIPVLYRSVNVLMRADLSPWVQGRPAALYFIEQPDLQATFLTINGTERLGFLVNNLAVDGPAEEYDAERCADVIRVAAGVPDLRVDILGIDPWTCAAQVAERYRGGRVFLAGDAAHHMPPTGRFGLNTGVQDVHNLAWKLAAVVQGWAADSVLDTYEEERLPYGRAITEQCVVNLYSMGRGRVPGGPRPSANGTNARPEYLNELGMMFGASCQSAAVIPDGTPLPEVANPVADDLPVARPGSRAPHVWLERSGRRISTLDLVDRGFTLLAGPAGAAWRDAASALAQAHGVPLRVCVVGDDVQDPDDRWTGAYGIDADGAVLIRPDGHVAWRRRTGVPDPARELKKVLHSVLGRGH